MSFTFFPGPRILFIHIPKTGGTSIVNMLSEIFEYKERFIPGVDRKQKNAHLTAKELKSILGDLEFDNWYKFCFVRNPYSRMVSCWKHLTRYKEKIYNYYRYEHNKDPVLVEQIWQREKKKTFKKWVESMDISNPYRRPIHVSPQSEWVFDESKNPLVDDIYYFEDFIFETDRLFKNIGLNLGKIRWDNKTDHKPYIEYYCPSTAGIVQNNYGMDFDNFGYEIGKL